MGESSFVPTGRGEKGRGRVPETGANERERKVGEKKKKKKSERRRKREEGTVGKMRKALSSSCVGRGGGGRKKSSPFRKKGRKEKRGKRRRWVKGGKNPVFAMEGGGRGVCFAGEKKKKGRGKERGTWSQLPILSGKKKKTPKRKKEGGGGG